MIATIVHTRPTMCVVSLRTLRDSGLWWSIHTLSRSLGSRAVRLFRSPCSAWWLSGWRCTDVQPIRFQERSLRADVVLNIVVVQSYQMWKADNPFTPKFKKYILPTIKEKCISDIVRISSIIVYYLNKLSQVLHTVWCYTVEPRYFEVPRDMKNSSK